MSKRLFHINLALIAGLMLVFGDAFFLCAQETGTEEFTLEEITVTAQKREENQQKVPIAMEVISGEQLAATGKTNVDDILRSVSNVLVNFTEDGMRVSLRGITENEVLMNDIHVSNPTVAINIDGAFNKSSSAGQNLFDVERVEVLMGPQSTLYASNSPGGIVNVVTAAPKTDKFSASGNVEVGNFGLLKAQAMVNVPITTDKVAMRLAGNMEKRDPYVSGENQTGEDTRSARLKTLWQASDIFSATVTLNYSKRVNSGMRGGQVQAFDYEDGYWYTMAGVKGDKVTDPWTAVSAGMGGPPGAAPNGPNQAAQITKGITAEINWDSVIGSLAVVPQYSKSTSDDQGQNEATDGTIYMAYTHMSDVQKGFEARMTSAEDFIFKWIAGVNYYKSDNARLTDYSAYYDYTKEFSIKEDKKAVYANITYPITDSFRATGGYRQSWDKIDVYEFPETIIAGGKYGQNYTSPDYNVGVEYDLADNSMLYVNYKTSYRVNPMTANQGERTIPPEKLMAYTVGVKNRFLENKLQVNAAAYYYDYKNKEAQVNEDGRVGRGVTVFESDIVTPEGNPYDSNGNGIPGETTVQLMGGPGSEDPWIKQHGTFRSIGADVSMDWLATSRDKINLGISYLNAKWKDLEMVFYWHKLADDGVTVIPYWDSDGDNYSGRKNTYSPTWTLNAGYEHNFMLGTLGMLVPRVDLLYKTEYILDYQSANYPVNYQESYYLVNGSATFSHAGGMWSFNAYVKNATNYAAKNYLRSGMGFSMGISDPRTYGAVLSVKF